MLLPESERPDPEEGFLRAFAELAERAARWSSPMRWKRRFELTAGDDSFASMEWERASGSLVVVRTSKHAWTLSTDGPSGSQIAVRDAVRGTEVAQFRGDWRGGGHVERASGPSLSWSGANVWMTRWVFRDHLGHPLVEFRVDAMRLVPTATVRFEPGITATEDGPLLATLGWHLAVQAFDQSAQLAAVSGT